MFSGAQFYGKTSFSQMFPNWVAEPVNCEGMFRGANTDVGMALDIDISQCLNVRYFLQNTTSRFDPQQLDFSAATNLESCFDTHKIGASLLGWLATQTFASATNTTAMFKNSLDSISQDPAFTAATFANVTNAESMFEGCQCEGIDLQNSTFAALESSTNMFYGCAYLESINLGAATFANVTNANGMFYNCKKLKTLNVPSSVTMAVSLGLAQSNQLLVASFDNIAVWAKDLTGLSAKTITLNATAVANWKSIPAQNLIYTAAKNALETKNWTLQG